MKKFVVRLLEPVKFNNWISDVLIAIPRIVAGLLLAFDFGASKFGMPWTAPEQNLNLFEVAAWFPEDVAKFGFPFSIAPVFFAWMAAATEAIGGLFLAIGFKTRAIAFLVCITMLTAIFFQKWGQGSWGMLPAMGFLWVSMYSLVLGSGRIGIDYLLARRFSKL